jgi:hypothetical protein
MNLATRIRVVVLPTAAHIAIAALAADSDPRRRRPGPQPVPRPTGFQIAPVVLNFRGKNRELVGLGSYIVNAQGGCNDCHTCPPYTPDHDPFTGGDGVPNAANYLAGGTAFGPFFSRNITPDDSGKPAGLTREEFIKLMRKGHDPDNPGELLQVMPWPVYGRMVNRDLAAVYEYLRSIPHAETGPGARRPRVSDEGS